MYEELHIENFRGLRNLKLIGLRRVNLLVGANNCGKTSVLEAVHLLSSQDHIVPLLNASARRGEYRDGSEGYELDISHLFYGREIEEGSTIRIEGKFKESLRTLKASFQLPEGAVRARDKMLSSIDLYEEELSIKENILESFPLQLNLEWEGGIEPHQVSWPLTRHNGIPAQIGLDLRRRVSRPKFANSEDDFPVVEMITTDGLIPEKVTELFDAIALTPEEELVTTTLRSIEPGIERIALSRIPRRTLSDTSRAGIRLSINGHRVPIGSLGDGMWRLLGIALSLVGSRGGILLVDEIDTGLHYSVLTRMWRLLIDTSKRLGVQVFATTHSRDCVDALAEVVRDDGRDISLQRVEQGKTEAISFSEAAIKRAAERGIEVR